MRSTTCDRQRHWQSCFFVQGAGRIFGFVVDCIKNKLERIFPCLRIGKYWMNFFVQSKIMLLTLHLWDFVSHHLSSKRRKMKHGNSDSRKSNINQWQISACVTLSHCIDSPLVPIEPEEGRQTGRLKELNSIEMVYSA